MVASERTLVATQSRAKNGVRLKTIVLPAEHGGWGLLFEPIALGLLVAPSIAGFYLARQVIAADAYRRAGLSTFAVGNGGSPISAGLTVDRLGAALGHLGVGIDGGRL